MHQDIVFEPDQLEQDCTTNFIFSLMFNNLLKLGKKMQSNKIIKIISPTRLDFELEL